MGTLDREPLREQVESWFAPACLEQLLGTPATPTESMAQAALAQGGKRWRQVLADMVSRIFPDAPAATAAKAADEPLGAESAA